MILHPVQSYQPKHYFRPCAPTQINRTAQEIMCIPGLQNTIKQVFDLASKPPVSQLNPVPDIHGTQPNQKWSDVPAPHPTGTIRSSAQVPSEVTSKCPNRAELLCWCEKDYDYNGKVVLIFWLMDVYTFNMSSSCHEVYLVLFICCVQIFSFSHYSMSYIYLNSCYILATCLCVLVLFFSPLFILFFLYPSSSVPLEF